MGDRTWWLIGVDGLPVQAVGKPRDHGYWFFPGVGQPGWGSSIPESELFESEAGAASEALARLERQVERLASQRTKLVAIIGGGA